MKGFARLFKEGRLSVVQGVGYPNSDRNHPGAMRDWHTGRPHVAALPRPAGWAARSTRSAGDGQAVVPGVFVGGIPQPFALNAEKAVVPSIPSLEQATDTPAGRGVRQQRGRLVEIAR